jgi:hypothetical protein
MDQTNIPASYAGLKKNFTVAGGLRVFPGTASGEHPMQRFG